MGKKNEDRGNRPKSDLANDAKDRVGHHTYKKIGRNKICKVSKGEHKWNGKYRYPYNCVPTIRERLCDCGKQLETEYECQHCKKWHTFNQMMKCKSENRIINLWR